MHLEKEIPGPHEKQDIEVPESFSNKTKQHIQRLFSAFGYDKFFGRTEVMNLLEITASPASELIKKMLESEFRQENIHFRTAEMGYYIGEKY